MERHNQPITVVGVPLKGIITTLVFLTLLFAVFDPFDFQSTISDVVSSSQEKEQDADQSRQENNIVATPEMISKAANEIRAEKIADYERSENVSPTDQFFYIVELSNGGDIEASDVTIEPDRVTIVSRSGIETIIPRTTIKNIRRYKLPDQPQPQSSP